MKFRQGIRCKFCKSNRLKPEASPRFEKLFSEGFVLSVRLVVATICATCGHPRGEAPHPIEVEPAKVHTCPRIGIEDTRETYVVTSASATILQRVRVKETVGGFERPLWKSPATYYDGEVSVTCRCTKCNRTVRAYSEKVRIPARDFTPI